MESTSCAAGPRIVRLKKRLLEMRPAISAERDLLMTEAYRSTENFPTIIRRARILENILQNMPIRIFEDELVVGNMVCGQFRHVGLFLEMSAGWKEKELDRFPERESDQFQISEETKEQFRQLIGFWKGRTLHSKAMALIPEASKRAMEANAFFVNLHLFSGLGHVTLGYAKALENGFRGIGEEIQKRLGRLDLANPEDLRAYHFLQALQVTSQAACAFAGRYAREARRLANEENRKDRRTELIQIAEACERVPYLPARTLREAVQSFFFVQLITQIESDGTGVSPGRFDQYMYSYYAQDLAEGRITPRETQELLDSLWIKLNEIIKVWSEEDARSFGGFPISQNLIVGGQDCQGRDATNEMSYMCLQALQDVHLPQPAMSVRLHRASPDKFVLKVCEVVSEGSGMPAIFSDEAIIPALLARGVPMPDARDYAIVGCVEPSIMGKDWPRSHGGFINLVKPLQFALNNGRCELRGDLFGPQTGEPEQLDSFDKLLEAYRSQLSCMIRHVAIINNVVDAVHADNVPLPFVSSITEDCIDKGKDVTSGGARYNATGPCGVGLGTTVDALVAIRKLVYQDKRITLRRFVEILDHDFSGEEELRLELSNRMPKYGNDIREVDAVARTVVDMYVKEITSYRNLAGAGFQAEFAPVSSNVPLGKLTGATADGRRAFEPLSEGISPTQGKDRNGPSAMIKSASSFDHSSVGLGTLLNLKLSPTSFSDRKGLRTLKALVETYFDLGGSHVQINVVDEKTLREAQAKPDQYRHLVVRVAGYSAFFTDLSRQTQDDIIARTAHHLND